jgi:hypothetical protein
MKGFIEIEHAGRMRLIAVSAIVAVTKEAPAGYNTNYPTRTYPTYISLSHSIPSDVSNTTATLSVNQNYQQVLQLIQAAL